MGRASSQAISSIGCRSSVSADLNTSNRLTARGSWLRAPKKQIDSSGSRFLGLLAPKTREHDGRQKQKQKQKQEKVELWNGNVARGSSSLLARR